MKTTYRSSLFNLKSSVTRGFTLVELMAVIAIIAILTATVFLLAPGVSNSQKFAVTRGYIGTLGASAEQYRNVFREYPTYEGDSGDDEGWRLAFYANLSGLKVLKFEDNKVRLVPYAEVVDSNNRPPARRSFIAESTLKFNAPIGTATPDENQRYFVDGWENPIAYRYRTITGGELGKSWESPRFLLVSAGAKYHDPEPTTADYFTGDMESSGRIPNEYADNYRADNVVNWKKD
jgi:prepilin-type N-terminal cleavage/methylation domain-containing protein